LPSELRWFELTEEPTDEPNNRQSLSKRERT